MTSTEEQLRFILGLKLRQYREAQGLSLRDLATRSGLSISYLSEIEHGKKYPKPQKLLQLAEALNVSFDELVSLKLDAHLSPLKDILDSPFLKVFPFELFGLDSESIFGILSQMPEKAAALIHTFLEIGQMYDMRVEQFLFAALRSYQQMHHNYFPDLEAAAKDFREEAKLPILRASDEHVYREQLITRYNYIIDEETLARHPTLHTFRSVFIPGDPPHLLVNGKLLPVQKAFIFARELGYQYLNLSERAYTSSWLKVTSFDQVINNFRASYFAGALLLDLDRITQDLQEMFARPSWDPQLLIRLINRYGTTPEMLFYRMTEVIPRFFGMHELFFLRLNTTRENGTYRLTKMLNLSRIPLPHGLGLNDTYCRRWIGIQLLERIRKENGTLLAGAQRSAFLDPGATFLTLSLARPLALSPDTYSSVTIGFLINDTLKERIRFWNDVHIPEKVVNLTCERCPLDSESCSERAAPPVHYLKEQHQKEQEYALRQLFEQYGASVPGV